MRSFLIFHLPTGDAPLASRLIRKLPQTTKTLMLLLIGMNGTTIYLHNSAAQNERRSDESSKNPKIKISKNHISDQFWQIKLCNKQILLHKRAQSQFLSYFVDSKHIAFDEKSMSSWLNVNFMTLDPASIVEIFRTRKTLVIESLKLTNIRIHSTWPRRHSDYDWHRVHTRMFRAWG